MASLAARYRDGRVVMLGDFNTTPYSPIFPEVLKIGRLRDSALGFVPQTTWQSRFPLFGLPIDHILVGHGVSVLDRHVGAGIGSDHFPIIADLAF
jgi:endonuclease/exonuclease/phosphatase (EEP) superfamily protein YafD